TNRRGPDAGPWPARPSGPPWPPRPRTCGPRHAGAGLAGQRTPWRGGVPPDALLAHGTPSSRISFGGIITLCCSGSIGTKLFGINWHLPYQALIVDDLGYVQQSREEMEVLFLLLAERYERGSVLLSSNLAFSQWEQIFKDAMTTAAAIDRLVHHSVIVELNVPSFRLETAKSAQTPAADPTP